MSNDVLSFYEMAPGKRIAGRYRVGETRRQGGLSTAFEATELESGARCELQFFPLGMFANAAQASDFVQRFTPWQQLSSKSLLRVREVLQLSELSLLLVTDHPGEDVLAQRLKLGGPMPQSKVLRLAREVLGGLMEIHSAGLVHGDIKPQTIFFRPKDGGALLVDGGVTPCLWSAKHLGDRTALIGTPYYAPVEQFGGESPDALSDIYNLATVLFECATGLLPWAGNNVLEVFQAKLDRARPSIKKRAPGLALDARLVDAIERGLMAERGARHPSAAAFLEALKGLAENGA